MAAGVRLRSKNINYSNAFWHVIGVARDHQGPPTISPTGARTGCYERFDRKRATHPDFVFALLQWDAHAPGVGQGRAATTIRPTIWDHLWSHQSCPDCIIDTRAYGFREGRDLGKRSWPERYGLDLHTRSRGSWLDGSNQYPYREALGRGRLRSVTHGCIGPRTPSALEKLLRPIRFER